MRKIKRPFIYIHKKFLFYITKTIVNTISISFSCDTNLFGYTLYQQEQCQLCHFLFNSPGYTWDRGVPCKLIYITGIRPETELLQIDHRFCAYAVKITKFFGSITGMSLQKGNEMLYWQYYAFRQGIRNGDWNSNFKSQ